MIPINPDIRETPVGTMAYELRQTIKEKVVPLPFGIDWLTAQALKLLGMPSMMRRLVLYR